MTRSAGGLNVTKQEWIKYGALLLLAVVAFGVADIALMIRAARTRWLSR